MLTGRLQAPGRIPIPLGDQTWLHMDQPTNLMNIHCVMWFRHRPDWEAVADTFIERIVARFPVMRRRACFVGGRWMWEDVPDFDPKGHIRHIALAAGSDVSAARAHIAERMAMPLQKGRPLWELDCIDGVVGLDGVEEETGSILLARFHHGLADGIRITQLVLGLCDHDAAAVPDVVGRDSRGKSARGVFADLGGHLARGTVDLARGLSDAALHAPRTAQTLVRGLREDPNPLRLPGRVIEALAHLGSEDNQVVNTWRSATRLALEPPAPSLAWSATPGVDKGVSWIDGIALDDVKAAARRHDATVTDIVFAAVSLGLTAYLRAAGCAPASAVNWMVPVSLRPIDDNLPDELGNHFALAFLRMPLGIDDPFEALRRVRSMLNRSKHSPEPMFTFGLQQIAALSPRVLARHFTDLFANKCAGQLTSVPGPRTPVSLAGTPVAGMLGWVPTSGRQTLGICTFTYAGRVSIGFAVDAAAVPDPDEMARHVRDRLHALITTAA